MIGEAFGILMWIALQGAAFGLGFSLMWRVFA
jgi:hypothetical protein